jgi:hypothetical protein
VIAEILATGQSVILMCACKDPTMCHRRAAAEQLAADLGQAVMHLCPHNKQRTQERLLFGECLPIRFCAQRRIICRENRRRGMATSLARLAMWLRILTAACVYGGSLAPPRGNDERHLHQLCP